MTINNKDKHHVVVGAIHDSLHTVDDCVRRWSVGRVREFSGDPEFHDRLFARKDLTNGSSIVCTYLHLPTCRRLLSPASKLKPATEAGDNSTATDRHDLISNKRARGVRESRCKQKNIVAK